MALPDLTGQNIQNTYQRVLQTDGGTLRDGTGSLVTNLTVDGTGSFGRIEVLHISSSTGDFDANTIRIGTFVSGTLFHDLNLNGGNNNITMGNGTTNLTLSGSINEAILDGGTF